MKNVSKLLEKVCRDHSELFVRGVSIIYGFNTLNEVPDSLERIACVLRPTIIDDFRMLTDENRTDLSKAYASPYGVAHFIVRNPDDKPERGHPLLDIAAQLENKIPVTFPLKHPLEGHHEAVTRFGPADGTVKIYNLPGKGGQAGYREQAETNELFDMHHDGLGSGGTVQTVVLYMDSPPLFGGFTYFQNIPLLALALAKCDPEAFRSLFLPDAITIIRPRGKGAIKVTTPVLFINDADRPQSFFRIASGEYQILWRENDALDRARNYLQRFARPFSAGSSFVHFTARGHGCLVDNQLVAHARTAFVDDQEHGFARLLSRKWFMRTDRDGTYKHVPGMFVTSRFADQYSAIGARHLLEGEWRYDADRDVNVRFA